MLDELPEADRALCATVFDRLVTPSGGKVLYTTTDLASVAKVALERMDTVLAALASGKNRLLRAVAPPAGEHARGYEILHDILARPILNWKEHYESARREEEARREAAEREKKAQAARFSRLAAWAAVGTALLALVAVALGLYGLDQQKKANAELKRYNEATGRGIWVNLDLTTPTLTPSEVDALWQLATANPVARAAFVQSMLSDSAPLVRFGRRPDAIMRALGLTWPAPEEAQRTLVAILAAIKGSTNPSQLRSLAQAAQALPVQLTAEQAQAALEPVLKAIAEAADGTSPTSAPRSGGRGARAA